MRTNPIYTTLIAAILWLVCLAGPTLAEQSADAIAIQKVMRGTWERPDAPLQIDPVVVVSDYAIAGWSQGEMGGRALLRRKDGAWVVVLCSGDGIKSAEALRHAGLTAADADSLYKRLDEAERKLPAQRLALFAKFEGTLLMDPAGAHPVGHNPPAHHPPAK